MFTVKFFGSYENGLYHRQRIYSAEDLTILKARDGSAEITLHQKNPSDSFRIDVEWEGFSERDPGSPPVYQKAVIENASGRTTEIVVLGPDPRKTASNLPQSGQLPGSSAHKIADARLAQG